MSSSFVKQIINFISKSLPIKAKKIDPTYLNYYKSNLFQYNKLHSVEGTFKKTSLFSSKFPFRYFNKHAMVSSLNSYFFNYNRLAGYSQQAACEKSKIVIIFLDIDGVIFNNPADGSVQRLVKEKFKGREHELPLPYPNNECDQAAVKLFNTISLAHLDNLIKYIKGEFNTEVGIVLSSDWRTKGNIEFLKSLFEPHQFSAYLIDKTPVEPSNRADQIQKWLSDNQGKFNIANFLIIDDIDLGLSEKFPNQFVYCKNLFLTNEASKAKQLLSLNSNKNNLQPK